MKLEASQVDALTEIMNIGVGRSAAMLNQMVRLDIRLNVPSIRVLTLVDFNRAMADFGLEPLSIVKLDFGGAFSGTAQLVLPADSSSHLVAVLTGEQMGSPDLDALRSATLGEVGNIILNGVMGSIVNILEDTLSFEPPQYFEDTAERILTLENTAGDEVLLQARAGFATSDGKIEGDIVILFEAASFKALVAAIDKIMPDSMAG